MAVKEHQGKRYHIAVIGGGINGLCTAWLLANSGHTVELFERDSLVSATSRSSTKLLHGGLRYLENLEFRLVREALHERAWWLAQAPHLAHPLRIHLPIYRNIGRPAWKVGLGLWLYDKMAGANSISPHSRLDQRAITAECPELKSAELIGGFTFFDGQMDDYQLGLWTAEQARLAGVIMHENAPVTAMDIQGRLEVGNQQKRFDWIINVAGPWAHELLKQNSIASALQLDLVRGSHLIFSQACEHAFMLQVPNERRIIFVCPYNGKTLVGTTEVRQSLQDPIRCSDAERDYLLQNYNYYFNIKRNESDIHSTFAGVRPLIRSATDASRATREYAIERQGAIISVFGGKWTTARALARAVVKRVTLER